MRYAQVALSAHPRNQKKKKSAKTAHFSGFKKKAKIIKKNLHAPTASRVLHTPDDDYDDDADDDPFPCFAFREASYSAARARCFLSCRR